MNLQERKDLLLRLGSYMLGNDEQWQMVKHRAYLNNNWFIPEFVDLAIKNIAGNYLQERELDGLIQTYHLPPNNSHPHKVGIVMAGNIPLVGFHDFLCVFISGHQAQIKTSSKDEALIKHLVQKMAQWNEEVNHLVQFSEMLKGCDAYIATGSDNTSRYFDYYFSKYPHIIRRNRTSIAVLSGQETPEELEKLADDVYQYFGLGCRNITKLFVPRNYDFIPLLDAFKKYNYLINHNKYKNNYDYHLSVHILNNRYYMTNGSILLVEDPAPFSPIGQLHFEFYDQREEVLKKLQHNDAVQCLIGNGLTDFGSAQQPGICDFADGVDTMAFLAGLK